MTNSTLDNEDDFVEILDIPANPEANDMTYTFETLPLATRVIVQRQPIPTTVTENLYLDFYEFEVISPSTIME